ncbi:MAG: hypothetical protein PHG51_05975, partial [Candidatus Omnitrophica bacterium]|nr:hypothetical protein [Candidatus Omnitrophota bacterium]
MAKSTKRKKQAAKKSVKKSVKKKKIAKKRMPKRRTVKRVSAKRRPALRFKKIKAASKEKKPIGARQTVFILDFGSQYTQLITRRIRESKVFSLIVPYNISAEEIKARAPKGLILSGGPASIYDKK